MILIEVSGIQLEGRNGNSSRVSTSKIGRRSVIASPPGVYEKP
jgi:hypothetical protein